MVCIQNGEDLKFIWQLVFAGFSSCDGICNQKDHFNPEYILMLKNYRVYAVGQSNQ